jgi:hypothetical protein
MDGSTSAWMMEYMNMEGIVHRHFGNIINMDEIHKHFGVHKVVRSR